ncbi:MAG: 2OG-Fe(II) oxygenase family protein, partial [Gammaproteobacteria bacterium]|nr:2OG-Fe(II) oxygenase family protein [Gammaproteobacteria bacterium]
AGALEFGQLPARVIHTREPERRIVAPVAGRLVVFPSYFYHRTLPFVSGEQRISIAFDVMPMRD